MDLCLLISKDEIAEIYLFSINRDAKNTLSHVTYHYEVLILKFIYFLYILSFT